MATIIPLRYGPVRGKTIAYGHHGCVQVFDGCEATYAAAREGFEQILSFEPLMNFFLISERDAWVYVRAGRVAGARPLSNRPPPTMRTELTEAGEQYVLPGAERIERKPGTQLKLW